MPKETSIFTVIVVPDESIDSGASACFSLCFELNAQHNIFKGIGDLEVWKKTVMDYHKHISEALALTQLSIGTNNYNFDIVDEYRDTQYNNIRTLLWGDFLGFTKQISGQNIALKLPQKKVNGKYLEIEKQSVEEMDVSILESRGDKLSQAISEVSKLSSSQTVDEVIQKIKEVFKSKEGELNDKVKEGIGNATMAYAIRNGKRNEGIKTSELSGAYYQNSLKKHMQKTKAAFETQAKKKSFEESTQLKADELIGHYLEFKALAETVINEPEFIKKGTEYINNILPLRKLLRTIIQIKIPQNLLPESGNFNVGLVYAPQNPPTAPDTIANTYIDTRLNTACIRTADKLNPSIPIPISGEENIIRGLLKLGTNCEILDYEEEAVQQNAIAALMYHKDAQIPESIKTMPLRKQSEFSGSKPILNAATKEDRESNLEYMRISSEKMQAKAVLRSLNNHIANTETKGQAVYVKQFIDLKKTSNEILYMGDLATGLSVFARKKGEQKCVSLTEIKEELSFPAKMPKQQAKLAEMGVNLGIGVMSTTNEKGEYTSKLNVLKNKFLFFWDGTRIGSMNPMQHYENQPLSETETAEQFRDTRNDVEIEVLTLEQSLKKSFAIDWFPFKKRTDEEKINVLLKRSFNYSSELKLKFGESYEYLLAFQLPNGYVPMKKGIESDDPNLLPQIETCKTSCNSPFLRHQHIRDMTVLLETDIYDDEKAQRLKVENPGESHVDLVVRTGSLLNQNTCVRYILPPPVPNFQTYLWYNRTGSLADRQLTDAGSFDWYRRYTKGIVQPRVYTAAGQSYLPDPVVTGFIIEFYADPSRHIKAGVQFPDLIYKYPMGDYPKIKPWKIILQKDPKEDSADSKVVVNEISREIKVLVKKGLQLFANVIPTFEETASHFSGSLYDPTPFEKRGARSNLYSNTLVSNITKMSFTHACQFPVVEPTINAVVISRFQSNAKDSGAIKEESFEAKVKLIFEHLNLWNGAPIDDVLPTGELELYGLWNDYWDQSRMPQKSIAEKRVNGIPGGFLRLGTIKFAALKSSPALMSLTALTDDPFKFTAEDITFVSDSNLSIPHHTDAVFKIRNTSKFSSYFSGKQDVEEEEKEQFSKWSKEFMLTSDKNISPASSDLKSGAAYIFNNKKLKAPRLAKLIPLKLTDVYDKQVREHNNWFRFYFEKDEMNKSGKGQRIAVVLDKSKGSFVYENYFKSNDWISKAGTDIVTVNPSLKLPGTSVVRNNIIIDEKITGEKYYDLFQPLYHGKNDPNETLELMSYLPVYDSVQDLWYIDIGFDFRSVKKKEVHTVFAQLNFVNFQPFSANYNVDTTGYSDSKSGYELDYRFSTPAQADFISVFPSRQYKNHWSLLKKNADEAFVFTVQTESLYFKADKLLTQFFVSVQKKQAGDFWTTIASTKSLSQSPAFFHPLLNTTLTPSTSIAEAKFSLDWKDTGTVRAVIMEVDYFNEEKGLDALQAHIDTISKNGGGYDVSDIPGVWVRNIFIISK